MRKKAVATTILAVIFVLIAIVSVLFSTGIFQNTALGTGDSFTLIGSSLEISDPIPVSNTGFYPYTKSNHWTYTGALEGSTDQNLAINGVNCAVLNEPIGQRKIRVGVNYAIDNRLEVAHITVGTSGDNTPNYQTDNTLDNYLMESTPSNLFRADSGSGNILIDLTPNPFNNDVSVAVAGITQQSFAFNSNSPKYLWVCAWKSSRASAEVNLQNLRYQPTLGCENDPTDAIVERTFTSGQTINLDSFKYPVKQFCYSSPIYVVRQTDSGASSGVTYDGSVAVFSTLAQQGGSVTIPDGDIWRVTYSTDNSKGLIATSCGSQSVDEETNQCVPLVVDLSEGTIDTNTNTFVIEPKVLCEEKFTNEDGTPVKGSYNVQTGQCVLTQAILEYCDVNTDECQLRVQDTCKTFGFDWNAELQRCESESTITPSGEVKTKIVYFSLWTYTFLGMAILFALISIYFAMRKRR